MADSFFDQVANQVKKNTVTTSARSGGSVSAQKNMQKSSASKSRTASSSASKGASAKKAPAQTTRNKIITSDMSRGSKMKSRIGTSISSDMTSNLVKTLVENPCGECDTSVIDDYIETRRLSPVQSAIVFGEVLATPVCKKHR